MRLRAQTDRFTTLLLASLGFAPIGACGGASETGGGSGAAGEAEIGLGCDTIPGTSGMGSGGTIDSGVGSLNRFPCQSAPQDAMAAGGYAQCTNGVTHRPLKVSCPSFLPREVVFGTDAGPSGLDYCQRDTDCVDRSHGYCGFDNWAGGPRPLIATCSYGCLRDDECGMNEICVCGDPVGHCEGASCTADAQCSAGFVCGAY